MKRPYITQSLTDEDEIVDILENIYNNELNINKVTFIVDSALNKIEYEDFDKIISSGFVEEDVVRAMKNFIRKDFPSHLDMIEDKIKLAMEKFRLNSQVYEDHISEWSNYADEADSEIEKLNAEIKSLSKEISELKSLEKYRQFEERLKAVESKIYEQKPIEMNKQPEIVNKVPEQVNKPKEEKKEVENNATKRYATKS